MALSKSGKRCASYMLEILSGMKYFPRYIPECCYDTAASIHGEADEGKQYVMRIMCHR